MKLTLGNAQHQGSREEQQDAFAYSGGEDPAWLAHAGILGVLADGMGGHAGGAEAARAAVQAFLAAYEGKPSEEARSAALLRALDAAQAAVRQVQISGAGSTLVAAIVAETELHWLSVGDSSVLLVRQGAVQQLNTPHIYAWALDRLAEMGEISQEEAASHPERGALVKYLGMNRLEHAEQNAEPIALRAGDRVLLASDGLTNPLAADEIAALAGEGPAQQICERLLAAVLEKACPEQDNVTVLCFALDVDLPPTRRIPEPELEISTQETAGRPWWKLWSRRKGGGEDGL